MSIQYTSSYITHQTYWDGDKHAPRTPWGPAQSIYDYANGIKQVDTAGHGGIRVCKSLQSKLPKPFRKTWFEEDCEVMIVLYFFFDELKAIADDAVGKSHENTGCLPYMRSASKEEIFSDFFQWFGGQYDAHNKTPKRELAFFKSLNSIEEKDAERWFGYYCDSYDKALAEKAKLTSKTPLKHGMLVQFASHFHFSLGSKKEKVSLFKVNKIGRRTLFIPQEGTFKEAFHASLTGWRKCDYKVLA